MSRYAGLEINRIRANNPYFRTIRNLVDAWNIFNDENLDNNELSNHNNDLSIIISNIRRGLLNDRFFDYSLLIRLAIEELQSGISEGREYNINNLLVDEYQDVNHSQELLIQEIHNSGAKLFVVGDDDQAIYSWRGADVTNILTFTSRYSDCARCVLNTNYRSVEPIVELSSNFISNQISVTRLEKNPIASADNARFDNHLGKFWFENRIEEAQWIGNRISYLLGTDFEEKNGEIRGLSPSDFAILMPSTNQPEGGRGNPPRHHYYSEVLNQLGIPFEIRSQNTIFSFASVQLLRNTFELLRNNNLSLDQAQNFFTENVVPIFHNADLNYFLRTMERWRREIHDPYTERRRKVSPQEVLYSILNTFGFKDSNFNEIEMQAIGTFSSLMQDIESVYVTIDDSNRFTQILNYINNVTDNAYETSSELNLQRPDAVLISTIHGVKGLEFPVVFVADVEQGRMPGRRRSYNGILPAEMIQNALNRGSYINNPEGEARVFYTALTRAERFLYVTGSRNLPGGSRERTISVFFNNLEHSSLIEDSSIRPEVSSNYEQKPRIDNRILPTTYSEIKYYLSCPKNYQFRKQYGFNPHVNEFYGYGINVHNAIGRIHQLYETTPPNTEEIRTITEDIFHLKHAIPSRDPINNPGQYEAAKESAVNLVTNYVEDFSDDFKDFKRVEASFEIPANNTIIAGSIDLLVRDDLRGLEDDVVVIDFKSLDESAISNKEDWVQLCIQIQLYARAANTIFDLNTTSGALHLLKDGRRFQIPVSDDAINASLNNIEWAVNKIISRDFPMRPFSRKCDECDFKLLCPQQLENFQDETNIPLPIHIPESESSEPIMVKAFSEVTI